ncbi:hypothetical protein JB92DRAFT_2898080 [Gautieria morchelliformis]|nr:hypothetical protein JB92DRAFT_2898080 [Gautieria morchelliformis]
MDTNFPPDLSIQASDPTSSLRSLVKALSVEQDGDSDEDIIVSSQSSDIECYGIAGRIWEAAYAMKIYLESTTPLEFDPQCSICTGRSGAVVELGAGNGFLGLKMAQILSSIPEQHDNQVKSLVLTDLEAVCPLLERNCLNGFLKATNASIDLIVQPLEWGNLDQGWRLADRLAPMGPSGTPDPTDALLTHIVCSDLVYFPELFAPLLRSLLQLSSPPFSTITQPVEIIISYMIRNLPKETPFWNAFGTWFNFSPVLVRRKSSAKLDWERFGDLEESTMFIYVATRKPETLSWSVPDDLELMKHGSDAFETLLLRNMFHGE